MCIRDRACTYAILRSTETFTRKVNIRILQCDDQVRSDTPIHDLEELKAYMENFQLVGGSATDFRPVFEHVAELQAEGAFTSLRGLVYFTEDRKSTRLNSSHSGESRMPSSA